MFKPTSQPPTIHPTFDYTIKQTITEIVCVAGPSSDLINVLDMFHQHSYVYINRILTQKVYNRGIIKINFIWRFLGVAKTAMSSKPRYIQVYTNTHTHTHMMKMSLCGLTFTFI